MIKSKLLKKVVSLIAAISIGVSLITTPVLAEGWNWEEDTLNLTDTEVMVSGTTEDNMPEITTDIVKLVDKDGKKTYEKVNDVGTLSVGNTIIVGIKAKNFDRFKDNAVNGGLYTLSTALIYDTRYLEPTLFYDEENDEYSFPQKITKLLAANTLNRWNLKTVRNPQFVGSYALDAAHEALPLNEDEKTTLDSDKNNLKKVDSTFLYTPPTGSEANTDLQLSIIGDEYITLYEFKVKAKPSEGTYSKGVQLSKSESFVLAFKNTATTNKTYTAVDGLHRYLKLTDGVNLWSSDNPVLTGLTMSTDDYTAPTQYVGKALNLGTPPTFTAVYDPNTSNKTVKNGDNGFAYKLGAANNTAVDALTDVPNPLTANENGSHLFATYTDGGVTKAVCLGQLTVSAKAITGIAFDDANSTFNDAGNTYYTSQNILDVLTGNGAKTLTADITYNNGDTDGADVAYAAFAGKGIALYQIKDNKLATIGTTDKFAESNTFYIAETGKAGKAPDDVSIKSAAITVSATTDTIVIKPKSAKGGKLKYTSDENEVDADGKHLNVIDFKDVKLTVKNASQADNEYSEKTVSTIGTSNLIFYYGDTSTAAYDAGKVITSGTTTYTSALKDKYVFVVPADDTAATPVLVGQLKDRAISTDSDDIGDGYTVTGITTDSTTQYGSKLGNGAKITVTYDNGDTKEISYAGFETEGITMKIVKADGTEVDASKDTVLTPAMNGGFVRFYYNNTLIGKSTVLTVNKKTVGYSSNANLETPSVTKEYDGTTKLAEADEAKVAFKINESDLVDDDLKGGKLDIDGVTYSYNSENVADADAIVASETTPATATTAGSLAVKASASGSTDAVNKFNANYTLAPLTANTTVYDRASITAKTLNVTTITGVPSVEVGATTGLTGTSTLTLKNNSDTDTNSNIVKGDAVTLTYKYDYTNADRSKAGNPVIEITATGKVGDTDLGISGTDAGNYTLNTTMPVTKGTVDNKKLDRLEVSTAPQAQTYPTTKLDLSGMKIKIHFENETAEPEPISVADFIADKGVISLVDATGATVSITAGNIKDVIELPVGKDTTLTITYDNNTNKAITQTVTVNKKPIKLSDITFTASKVYDDDEVDGEATFSTEGDKGLVAADNGKVQITATYTFTDKPESAGDNKNVTISNIALTGDAAGNYVIVNDDGTKITATTSKNIDTGVISQAAQTAPAAPTISVDPATNNIIVEGPLGENIEYSIDGGQTWQSDVTFTGLTKGKEYTVQARVKATADGNYAPSEPTASEPVTTFKYHVAIYKKNAKEGSEPAYEVYTNTTSAASKADLNALLPKKISNLKEFYTDAPATIKVEYPYTLAAENVLYYTTSGGGGGGTGSSVTITLDKTSVSGEVGDSEKVTATIKGSTATPKWTSSDEKVATVDQNGNITFVGEGKATVKINVSGTVKSVAVTVTEAKATPIPTVKPTVEPTNKPTDKPSEPIIDVNYTKPYASGYEDDTFRPENKITRAELAAMIARLSYGDDLPDGAYVSSFPDVEADAWFNKYVAYLEDKDVLNGYEDGTFRPYDTVTRGEISTVIARAQRYELITYSGIFADVTDSDWAKDYIQTLASQGIISGYEDGTFGPYSPLSRAEAVTIINNVLAPSTPIVTFTPNDIAGHWAEANIILAVNERMLGGAAVPVPVPEDTAPEATEVPAEEVVPEGELDPTVKDEPAVPVNPEAGAVTDEEQKFIVK